MTFFGRGFGIGLRGGGCLIHLSIQPTKIFLSDSIFTSLVLRLIAGVQAGVKCPTPVGSHSESCLERAATT